MAQLLLVGNSRWHWAEHADGVWRCWHTPPPEADAMPPWGELRAWAAVGSLPAGSQPPQERAMGLEQVPLRGLPPWLGVDRALVGWGAWRAKGCAALVADAGTALSLTWVDGEGCFRGGRISAGVALQRRSLGAATVLLAPPQGVGAEAAAGADRGPGVDGPPPRLQLLRQVRRALAAAAHPPAPAGAEAAAAELPVSID
ncbi:MAG: type III pantothenate kinase, partial [Vulcanococcus sp.]